MEIIRIPASYYNQIEYMSDQDVSYVMKTIFQLSNWFAPEIEKSMRWWLVISIYREATQMDNRTKIKKWGKGLIWDLAPKVPPKVLKNSTLGAEKQHPNKIKENKIKENKINKNKINENNKEIISSTAIAALTLKALIIWKIDKEKIKIEYKINEEEIRQELRSFYDYWKEKSINWKKERWQMEKTFDVNLRFVRWLNNAVKFKKSETIEEEKRRKLTEIEIKKRELFNNFK